MLASVFTCSFYSFLTAWSRKLAVCIVLRKTKTSTEKKTFSGQMILMRELKHLLSIYHPSPPGANHRETGQLWASGGQRYTALCIQIGRQLPPLTYTLSLWGLRPAGKLLEMFTQGDEEGILFGVWCTRRSFYAVIYMPRFINICLNIYLLYLVVCAAWLSSSYAVVSYHCLVICKCNYSLYNK